MNPIVRVGFAAPGTVFSAANDSRIVWRWFICRPRFAILGALVLALFLLSGCAASFGKIARWPAPEGYWSKTGPAVTAGEIVEVSEEELIRQCNGLAASVQVKPPAGEPSHGCFLNDGTVLLLKDMPPDVKDCVLGHEAFGKYSHAAGYSHTTLVPYIDCGDGTMLYVPLSEPPAFF